MKEGYLPLYRKYRPQKLTDIVGQKHIKKALSNAIELNKIAHAYLFTGPRGTGKTSTARILAKSLNCIKGPTLEPCEECESCKAITNTVPIDVIEIDAASNRSVDDAHEILEKVQYAPVNGKYKIYIIDEVHMLTTQAFNALLKTLEEPPQNVIFILATTEAHKVLDTIKSRCQRYDFKRITTSDIVEHLQKIAKLENINISDSAISLIAKTSAGGMRDSLALLDQVSIMGASEMITEDDINNLLGRLSFDVLFELASSVITSDFPSAINILEKIYNDGNEPIQILTNLMYFFKNMLIIKTCNSTSAVELTSLSQEQVKTLEAKIKDLEVHQLISLVDKTSEYIKEIKSSTNPHMWLEVGLIDLSNIVENTKLAELNSRIARLEGGDVSSPIPVKQLNPPIKSVQNIIPQKPTLVAEKEECKDVPKIEENVQEDLEQSEIISDKKDVSVNNKVDVKPDYSSYKDLDSLWFTILQKLLNDNISGLAKMKTMTSLSKFDSDGIVVVCKTQTFTDNMNVPEKRKKLIEAISEVIGTRDFNLTIRVKNSSDAQPKKVKLPAPKHSLVPQNIKENEDNDLEEKEIISSDSVSENSKEVSLQNEDGLSEQAVMVKNLFDGKVLE